jgi:hypothetical protein
MSNQNPFGGKNPFSLYVPMSETEQEFIHRLVASGDLLLKIHGWGFVPCPNIQVGDLQVVVPIDITFNAPEIPVPVHAFDLELCTHSGLTLFRESAGAVYDGQPLMVGAGTRVTMMWHIAIHNIDPQVIKAYMPGTVGLTSRTVDKDTGDITVLGNMRLGSEDQKLLHEVRRGEARVRRKVFS